MSCTAISSSAMRPGSALGKHYDTRQMIDLVFAVGQYTMVSMALNYVRRADRGSDAAMTERD